LAQSQTRAFARLLRGEEWVECLGQHIFCHAGSGVADSHQDAVTGRRILRPLRRWRSDKGSRHCQRPAARHGIARVDGEVQDGMLDLVWIDERHWQVGLEPQIDADLVAERARD
jgi:hypothetical protein